MCVVQYIIKMNKCILPCSKILSLRNHFLSGSDPKLYDFNNFFSHLYSLELEDQESHLNNLLQETVKNQLVVDRPLKTSYLKYFLKILMDGNEKSRCDSSDLYELYCFVLNAKDNSDYHYRHFSFDNKIVTVRENVSMISHGTTGMSIWQGGIALADWCLRNSALLLNKSVLELGCGVGMTGLIVCSSDCCPRQYCFTDTHESVLLSLKSNVDINSLKSDIHVKIQKLDWSKIEDYQSDFYPDVILGADIVYDPDLFPHIYKTLNYFIVKKAATGYLACTVRNRDTLTLFVAGLVKYSLCVECTSKLEPNKLIFNDEPQVILLKIISDSNCLSKTGLSAKELLSKVINI